jgi:hypothetical protein
MFYAYFFLLNHTALISESSMASRVQELGLEFHPHVA